LIVFENRMLRRMLGPKRAKVVGGWGRLHNAERRNLYASPNIRVNKSRRTRWAGHVARLGEMNGYTILVGEPEGKKPVGRPRRRWKYNIRMHRTEIRWNGVDWIHLAKYRD